MPADSSSNLPTILGRAGPLTAEHATDGQIVRSGCIFVAPPDRHLTVADGRLHVVRGPRENGHRPAIDPLFRSAAREGGARVIGVVLSGSLDDGATGLQAVKEAGGIAVAQDPEDALFAGMPMSAIELVAVDHVLPAEELGPLIAGLVGARSGKEGPSVPSEMPHANAEEQQHGQTRFDGLVQRRSQC